MLIFKYRILKKYITLFVLFFSLFSFAQDETVTRFTASNKGKVFFSWGGNRETYSRSDIRFYGDNYDFTLFDVKAQDNYIACSITVKAEIVVPIFVNGENIGQIDIDSNTANPFTDADERFLEFVCLEVASVMI